MAWTTPRTWTTSETVTAAMLNEQIRDNENYLKTQMDIADRRQCLDTITADTAVSGTAAETTLYTFSVPANTLGTNGMLRLQIWGTQNDANAAIVYKVKYGGTTLITTNNTGTIAGTNDFRMDVMLKGNGATNSQKASCTVTLIKENSVGGNGTAAEDSTAAKNLVVTVTPGHSSNSCTLFAAVLEVLTAV